MSQTTRQGEPVTPTPGRPGRTPPGHHWVKSLVPAALHHRLRAYAGLSEMTLPAFILATLTNAVPLAAPANAEGPSPTPTLPTLPGPGQGPLVEAPEPTPPPANAPPQARGSAADPQTRERNSHA